MTARTPAQSGRPIRWISRTLVLALLLGGLLYGGTYFRSAKPPAPPEPALTVPASVVLVQVLNESGLSGGAQRLARVLRAAGFDVVEMGNGGRANRERTEVVVRGDDMEKGAAVARAIHCDLIKAEKAPELLLDVTVYVGKDIDGLAALPE